MKGICTICRKDFDENIENWMYHNGETVCEGCKREYIHHIVGLQNFNEDEADFPVRTKKSEKITIDGKSQRIIFKSEDNLEKKRVNKTKSTLTHKGAKAPCGSLPL